MAYKDKAYQKEWQANNWKEKWRDLYNQKILDGVCVHRNCYEPSLSSTHLCHNHAYREAARSKIRRERDRKNIIDFLGGVCSVPGCGVTDCRMLEVDHVRGDGKSDRGNITRVKRNPDRYQLLCANHHRVKTWEAGEHTPRKWGELYV